MLHAFGKCFLLLNQHHLAISTTSSTKSGHYACITNHNTNIQHENIVSFSMAKNSYPLDQAQHYSNSSRRWSRTLLLLADRCHYYSNYYWYYFDGAVDIGCCYCCYYCRTMAHEMWCRATMTTNRWSISLNHFCLSSSERSTQFNYYYKLNIEYKYFE